MEGYMRTTCTCTVVQESCTCSLRRAAQESWAGSISEVQTRSRDVRLMRTASERLGICPLA